MKVFLVGLGLALLCAINVQSECVGDQKVVEGRWYVTALASDCKHFLDHKDNAKIVPFDISIPKDDKIKISTYMAMGNQCKHMLKEFSKLDDGTYFHSCEWGDKKMEILSTDCTTHGIAWGQFKTKKRNSKMLTIYTKEPELSPDLKEKFLEHARNLGFTEDQLIFPSEVACENEA